MAQKRVSFQVAKAIKKAGYSQDRSSNCYNADTGEFHYTSCSDNWLKIGNYIDAPTYLDVWLWLWREKNCYIQTLLFKHKVFKAYIFNNCPHYTGVLSANDPEEAIVAAVEHLCKNDLIK